MYLHYCILVFILTCLTEENKLDLNKSISTYTRNKPDFLKKNNIAEYGYIKVSSINYLKDYEEYYFEKLYFCVTIEKKFASDVYINYAFSSGVWTEDRYSKKTIELSINETISKETICSQKNDKSGPIGILKLRITGTKNYTLNVNWNISTINYQTHSCSVFNNSLYFVHHRILAKNWISLIV